MDRNCYDCKKSLTIEEAVEGQLTLDEANSRGHFEGWIHCMGPDSVFIQEDDTELKEALRKAGVKYWGEGGILICKECVIQVWEAETERKW